MPDELDSHAGAHDDQDWRDAVAAIYEGLADEKEGRVRPAREALRALGTRLGFQD